MVLKWTRTKPEPLKYFEQELNLNLNRYLKQFDTLRKTQFPVKLASNMVRYRATFHQHASKKLTANLKLQIIMYLEKVVIRTITIARFLTTYINIKSVIRLAIIYEKTAYKLWLWQALSQKDILVL